MMPMPIRMTFQMFQAECRKRAAERVFSRAWEMSFLAEDFDREWVVAARSSTLTASVRVYSANITATTPHDVVLGLGRLFIEMLSGDAEITPGQRAMLDELTAEAEKRLGY